MVMTKQELEVSAWEDKRIKDGCKDYKIWSDTVLAMLERKKDKIQKKIERRRQL